MNVQKFISWKVIAVLAGLLLLGGLDLIYQMNQAPTYYGGLIDPPKALPAFVLPSGSETISSGDFHGKIVALAFGYTSCPDVCPATLSNLNQAFKQLDAQDQAQLQVVWISVDYKRDTAQIASEFVQKFNAHFIGLAGSQAQIDQVTGDYGIYYQLNTPDPNTGYYSVDHTAVIMGLDRTGSLVITWPYDMAANRLAADLKTLIHRR